MWLTTVVRRVIRGWRDHKGPLLSASIAFYSVFSIAPLLIIATGVAGMVFGREAAHGEFVERLALLLGEDAARTIDHAVANAWRPADSILRALVGAFVFFWASTRVFVSIKFSMDQVWDVPLPEQPALRHMINRQLFAFVMVIAVGVVLLASLVAGTVIAFIDRHIDTGLPPTLDLIRFSNLGVGFALEVLAFTLIYRVVPGTRVRWGQAFAGAMVTAILFTLGRYAVWFYLGRSVVTATYGTAGSVVVLLIWFYYSAQVLVMGAEFTRAIDGVRS